MSALRRSESDDRGCRRGCGGRGCRFLGYGFVGCREFELEDGDRVSPWIEIRTKIAVADVDERIGERFSGLGDEDFGCAEGGVQRLDVGGDDGDVSQQWCNGAVWCSWDCLGSENRGQLVDCEKNVVCNIRSDFEVSNRRIITDLG